jgi:hypothetical protein
VEKEETVGHEAPVGAGSPGGGGAKTLAVVWASTYSE